MKNSTDIIPPENLSNVEASELEMANVKFDSIFKLFPHWAAIPSSFFTSTNLIKASASQNITATWNDMRLKDFAACEDRKKVEMKQKKSPTPPHFRDTSELCWIQYPLWFNTTPLTYDSFNSLTPERNHFTLIIASSELNSDIEFQSNACMGSAFTR